MNFKKITAFAAAFVLSLGVLAAVPEEAEDYDGAVVVASADDSWDSDFVDFDDDGFMITRSKKDGKVHLIDYDGKGGDIRIPDGVECIDERVFREKKTITSVTFPKSCTSVEAVAFSECEELKKVTFEGDAKIGTGSFGFCTSLKNVTINGAIIDEIGENAFVGCIYLRTIKISESENDFRIGERAFYNCWSLSSINIPNKCKSIDCAAFINCFSLKELTIPEKTELDEYSVGYSFLFAKKEQVGAAYITDGIEMLDFIGDGKKFGYEWNSKTQKIIKATPARLTLTVTKGSPAEKYAKENGIKYKYAK